MIELISDVAFFLMQHSKETVNNIDSARFLIIDVFYIV